MFCVINSDTGKYLGTIYASARTFRTGSKGLYGNGEITDPETRSRYIVNLQFVELGTKPVSANDDGKRAIKENM